MANKNFVKTLKIRGLPILFFRDCNLISNVMITTDCPA